MIDPERAAELARALRLRARELADWQARTLLLFGSLGPLWSGDAAAEFASAGTAITGSVHGHAERLRRVAAAVSELAAAAAESAARSQALSVLASSRPGGIGASRLSQPLAELAVLEQRAVSAVLDQLAGLRRQRRP